VVAARLFKARRFAELAKVMNNPPRRTEIRGQDHMLAYITPGEASVLKALGGSGEAGPMGIPSYPEDSSPSVGGSGYGGGSGSGDHSGGANSASSANEGYGSHDTGQNTGGPATSDRGFFGSIMDEITGNPVSSALSALGMLTGVPAFGIMGLASRLGKAYGDPNSVGSVTGPSDEGGGPAKSQVQQIVPTFNPIEDMVGSEYVAYGGVGADQLRRQLFPYMNFNQPTQPGITGLVGQYAGAGQGTGLMTGPFGASNTQV